MESPESPELDEDCAGMVYYMVEIKAMICQKCKKNIATIRYAEVVGGHVSELMICQECYKEMQHSSSLGFEISGGAPKPNLRQLRPRENTAGRPFRVCKACGVNLDEALEEGKMGCPACYENAGMGLWERLSEIQEIADRSSGVRVMVHRGKQPHIDDAREKLRLELRTKRALIRNAVAAENYEEAARLRDIIRALEEELKAVTEAENGEKEGDVANA